LEELTWYEENRSKIDLTEEAILNGSREEQDEYQGEYVKTENISLVVKLPLSLERVLNSK